MKQSNQKILHAPGLLDGEWRIYGNPDGCHVNNGVLTTQDCWAAAENMQFENFDFRFRARAPEGASQVDIWACFRHFNRDYRYMVGLRGGSHKHLYLARMGARGYDKMLALRPLEWYPVPGVWYQMRVVCAGNTISVYLNNEQKPLILCEDSDATFHSGCVALGSSFVATEYKDISVMEVEENVLKNVEKQPEFLDSVMLTPEVKEAIRRQNRANYRPYAVPRLPETRQELTLDGNWLFIPDYEIKENPEKLSYDDSKAHVMTVPAAWTPLKAWLEGETMGEGLNKGMTDTYHLEEYTRCMNQTFDYENTKSAWYRHYLDMPSGIESKRIVLDFEGIALVSSIYCNGVLVRENIGMFTPMQIDISEHLHEGRNIIAVKVQRRLPEKTSMLVDSDFIDNNYAKAREGGDAAIEAPVSDCIHREFCTEDLPHGFYSDNPGGIWRSVKLIISEKIHVDDCWFRPTLNDASIDVSYTNGGTSEENVTLVYNMVHKTTGEFLCGGTVETISLKPGEQRTTNFKTPKVFPRLWGPGTPNLYRLTFTIMRSGVVIDTYQEQVGFRTVHFEGSTLIYNGHPLWVRGGNHMPAHVRPNDAELARTFIATALDHNLMATRTHAAPWGSAWLDAADEGGLMISLEGTWPWLMLTTIPSPKSFEIWKKELRQLYRRNRNRPSLFLITLNNEMNFYLIPGSDKVVTEKGYLVQDGLRIAREEFPDLPLVCDSGYFRGPTTQNGRYKTLAVANGRYERIIQPNHFDDGDMDDPHFYFGWYEPSFFHFMNGEFGRDMTMPGRPCMSQECSVGYCRTGDGHATRAYLFDQQTPQTTTGKRAYEHNDPRYFQHNHAFQLQGLLEMFRRVEHERTCGVMLFSLETWFYHHYDSKRIQPMLSAERLKMAYQPVLASANLFGRHFYAGTILQTNVTIINDNGNYETLHTPRVEAQIVVGNKILEKTDLFYEDIPYFQNTTKSLTMQIPEELPEHRTEAKLVLKIWEKGNLLSVNDYEILLCDKVWTLPAAKQEKIWYISEDEAAQHLLKRHHLIGESCENISSLIGRADRLVIGGTINEQQGAELRAFAEAGGKVVLMNQKALPDELLSGKKISYTEDCMEILTMNIPESSLFNGIDELDTRWFANEQRVPYVANGWYDVDRMDPDVCALGETLQWHNYIAKPTDYYKIGGTPLFALRCGNGAVLISSVRTDADDVDPVACRLTGNTLTWDFDEI